MAAAPQGPCGVCRVFPATHEKPAACTTCPASVGAASLSTCAVCMYQPVRVRCATCVKLFGGVSHRDAFEKGKIQGKNHDDAVFMVTDILTGEARVFKTLDMETNKGYVDEAFFALYADRVAGVGAKIHDARATKHAPTGRVVIGITMEAGKTDGWKAMKWSMNMSQRNKDKYPDLAEGLFAQMVGMARQLHKFGVVHGDLKPDNFVLAGTKTDPANLRMIDFGFSAIHDLSALVLEDPRAGADPPLAAFDAIPFYMYLHVLAVGDEDDILDRAREWLDVPVTELKKMLRARDDYGKDLDELAGIVENPRRLFTEVVGNGVFDFLHTPDRYDIGIALWSMVTEASAENRDTHVYSDVFRGYVERIDVHAFDDMGNDAYNASGQDLRNAYSLVWRAVVALYDAGKLPASVPLPVVDLLTLWVVTMDYIQTNVITDSLLHSMAMSMHVVKALQEDNMYGQGAVVVYADAAYYQHGGAMHIRLKTAIRAKTDADAAQKAVAMQPVNVPARRSVGPPAPATPLERSPRVPDGRNTPAKRPRASASPGR